MINYYIDSDRGVVLVETDETDPNGFPLFVEYTLEEWDQLNSN